VAETGQRLRDVAGSHTQDQHHSVFSCLTVLSLDSQCVTGQHPLSPWLQECLHQPVWQLNLFMTLSYDLAIEICHMTKYLHDTGGWLVWAGWT